jgi:hypothetical protein
MSKFFVEVRTKLPTMLVIKREPAPNWGAAVHLAQHMATQMFPEDPMSSRSFRNGRYTYINRNDMGDPVSIRPLASLEEGIEIAGDIVDFFEHLTGAGPS